MATISKEQNERLAVAVNDISTMKDDIKEIKESKPFSSLSEYILPVGKNPPKISHEEFLKSMGTHDDRAVLNNYLRRYPNKQNSPYVLATEANIARNRLVENPFGQALNIGTKVLPYTNMQFTNDSENNPNPYTSTIPFEDELYNLDNINMNSTNKAQTYIPNPWQMPKPNIMTLPKLPFNN